MMMKDTLNFPFELLQFPLHADIACCGNYSSETCDFAPDLKFPDHDFANATMSLDVLEQFVEQYTEAQIHADIHYYWRGGDPLLMGIDFMQQAVAIQHRYAAGAEVYNHLHTPGVRINEAWCRFFCQHDFEVSLELDGPPRFNEVYRHLVTGSLARNIGRCACTERTVESLLLLRQYGVRHHVEVNVHDRNVGQPMETYEYLKNQGVQSMLFRPVVVWNKNKTAPQSVSAPAYGDFLVTVFDTWIRHDVGEIEILNFEQTMRQLSRPACQFAVTCGHHAYLSATGVLYPCRYFTQPEYALGALNEDTFTGLLYGRKQLRFGAHKQSTLTNQCRNCTYLDYCNGGCTRDRRITSDSGQRGHPYLCAAYKHYFSHVLIPLKYLANELRTGHQPQRMREYYK